MAEQAPYCLKVVGKDLRRSVGDLPERVRVTAKVGYEQLDPTIGNQ
jgi:hypothetical protein